MKIERIEGGRIEIKHNKRKGLKLRRAWTKDSESCEGCFLYEIGRHCKRESSRVNICGHNDIVFKKVE